MGFSWGLNRCRGGIHPFALGHASAAHKDPPAGWGAPRPQGDTSAPQLCLPWLQVLESSLCLVILSLVTERSPGHVWGSLRPARVGLASFPLVCLPFLSCVPSGSHALSAHVFAEAVSWCPSPHTGEQRAGQERRDADRQALTPGSITGRTGGLCGTMGRGRQAVRRPDRVRPALRLSWARRQRGGGRRPLGGSAVPGMRAKAGAQ